MLINADLAIHVNVELTEITLANVDDRHLLVLDTAEHDGMDALDHRRQAET